MAVSRGYENTMITCPKKKRPRRKQQKTEVDPILALLSVPDFHTCKATPKGSED
jgi:plastocyanin domain-containing protein